MSKFLGISYNAWHGVIPAVVMPIVMLISIVTFKASQLTFLLTLAASSIFLWMLQGVNESWQALGNVVKNYGSFENFQSNSKDDWLCFFIGWGAGTLLSVLIFVLIDKVF